MRAALSRLKKFALLLAVLGFASSAAGWPEGADAASSPGFQYNDITGLRIGGDFHLTDHRGKPRSLADFRGQVVGVSFGYTHCPDVCPTTLADLAQAVKRLGAAGDGVQILFITVDPARDTQQVLAQYLVAFDPRFLGLRGDDATTAKIAAAYKADFIVHRHAGGSGHYEVGHTGGIFLIDREGRMRLFVGGGRTVDGLVHDVSLLLRE